VARNLENARKVLREVCIQRRVTHPNVVQLHDVFWQPASTGEDALFLMKTIPMQNTLMISNPF
jgi:mitogen-activated protein kinase 1/3